jgi:hypothetical protein
MIAIAGIGLCTAQGSSAELIAGGTLAGPSPLPWPPSPRTTCAVGFAARGIDPALTGARRWHALADAALADLGGRRDVPILVGSCNGAAGELDLESWSRAFEDLGDEPIASAACASGLVALWLAAARIANGTDEVIVLAVDMLSRASHDNFEALRVLASDHAPWQATATGFVPGEAAVALRLVRGRDRPLHGRLLGPLLGSEVDSGDALAELAASVLPPAPALVLGQGTGPAAVDARELAAIREVPHATPLATALVHFGHTVGASGLLSVALGALARDHELAALAMPHPYATDGRALGGAVGDTLILCRALGGAVAACAVTDAPAAPRSRPRYTTSSASPPPALRMPLLRRIADEAPARRPPDPPGALLIRIDAPLVPAHDTRAGHRLLPSTILEMTPGFVAQLVARIWRYSGPAVCLVGGTEVAWQSTLAACNAVHGPIAALAVRGGDLEWQ